MSAELATRSLVECEAVIERGLATFVEVGEALLEIRDGRLYRDSHGTFEDYCRERWGFTPQHGGRLIAAAEVVGGLEPIGSMPPSEAVARELAPLRDEPEQVREAWTEAIERNGDKPTAAEVREVVQERTRGQLSNQKGGSDEWETPQDVFDDLDAEFSFDLDVCALPSSAKCERYFSPEDDGLAQEWTGTCWMNPPYGDEIVHWVKKASESAKAGTTVVGLVPARLGSRWFYDHCRSEVRIVLGRLKFGTAGVSAPFDSAVVVFGREPRVTWWKR